MWQLHFSSLGFVFVAVIVALLLIKQANHAMAAERGQPARLTQLKRRL